MDDETSGHLMELLQLYNALHHDLKCSSCSGPSVP